MSALQAFSALPSLVEHARRSQELMKLASVVSDDNKEAVLNAKFASDVRLIAGLEKTASRLISNLNSEGLRGALGSLGSSAAKGMGLGLGAAVPLGAAGYLLAEKTKDDFRNTALQAAVPLGIGAGVLGLSNMMGRPGKEASDGTSRAMDAAASYQVFSDLVKSAEAVDTEASEYYAEVVKIAAGHLADIVADVVLED
jgi:hypothetical protein